MPDSADSNLPAPAAAGGRTVRLMTPPGRGAVAVIEIQGPDAASAVESCFTCRQAVEFPSVPIGRILYGTWRSEDVVVVRVEECRWEVSCHGGVSAVSRIMDDLNAGSAAASTSFGNSLKTSDAATTRIVTPFGDSVRKLLLQTRTRLAATLLLSQFGGQLHRAIQQMASETESACRLQQLEALLHWASVAEHLVRPWRVLLLGPPNVGKSSLVNSITGFDRAIVCDQPGTTRDLLDGETVLNEWAFVFSDSAGIRHNSAGVLEKAGIDRVISSIHRFDACLIVQDAAGRISSSDLPWYLELTQDRPTALLWNKTDAVPTGCDAEFAEFVSHSRERGVQSFLVSATHRIGLQEVYDWLLQTLVPDQPTLDSAIPLPGPILEKLRGLNVLLKAQRHQAATEAISELLVLTR
jgi:tRNA modification GTPase